jgi:hypothetical protein
LYLWLSSNRSKVLYLFSRLRQCVRDARVA